MSAQIPETMLLSDLLKPTGYDCPEDLQGKTFEEATTGGGGDIDIETNKSLTISQNGTVVIDPSEGYDVMKKVTATVNVPASGGITKLYAWEEEDEGVVYLTASEHPGVGDKAYEQGSRIGSTITGVSISEVAENTITVGSYVCTRQPSADVNPLWS